MRPLLYILMIVFLTSRLAIAEEIRAYLQTTEAESVAPGEVRSWELVVWPLNLDLLNEVALRLRTPKAMHGLHIINLQKARFSENNADAVIFAFDAVLIEPVTESYLEVSWGTLTVPLRDVEVEEFEMMSEPVFKYSFSAGSGGLVPTLIVVVAVLTFLVMIYVLYRYRLRRRQKNQYELSRKQVWERASSAQTREDFEWLYSVNNKLQEFDLVDDWVANDILQKTINEHQYRKNWPPTLIEELKNLKEKAFKRGEH